MNNKVFVGGLNYDTDEKALEAAFSSFGLVINLRIIRDQESGKSKGFGFITFSNDEGAKEALQMDGEKLDGRFIGVKPAFEKHKR